MARRKVDKDEEPALEEPKLEEETEEEKTESEDKDEEPALEEGATTPPPLITADSPVLATPAPMGSKARAMREKLATQPKVRVYIPLAPGEKQGVTQSVVLNGYPMHIRKGMYVNVPQSVADVLEIKLKHKMSVENHPERISGDRPVKLTSYGN